MFTIRNSRNGHQDKRGDWVQDSGYNAERVELRCDSEAEAAKLQSVTSTTRDRLIAQAKACGNDKAEFAEVAEWKRVSFRKIDGKTGPFWTAVFVPGKPMESADLLL